MFHVTRALGYQLTYARHDIWLFCCIVTRDECIKRKPRHNCGDIFFRYQKVYSPGIKIKKDVIDLAKRWSHQVCLCTARADQFKNTEDARGKMLI